jgi:N-acetylmuramoyl-L-alanine amidase
VREVITLFRAILNLQIYILESLLIASIIFTPFKSKATEELHEQTKLVIVETPIEHPVDDEVEIIGIQINDENIEPDLELSREDINLIALVTMAEAEGECEEGKRLVIDTVLNRLESEHFPDTVQDVIYQQNQFSSVWNGRIDKCSVDNDIFELVESEITDRTNSDVVFFTAGRYSNYGVPLLQVEHHYFSSYE